jgi:DNA-binding CsgD family transcriptional regulator
MGEYNIEISAAFSFGLTRQECEILRRLAIGQRTEEIADELSVSTATVRSHIGAAVRKLDARGRAHLVIRAIEERILVRDVL